MKLHMHPVSMTSRPVPLFMAEKGLKAEEEGSWLSYDPGIDRV